MPNLEKRNNVAGREATFAFPVIDGTAHAYAPALGPLAKRVRALSMIATDLDRAQALLSVSLANSDALIHESLWASAIACYGRCFTSGEGRGMKLEALAHLAHLSTSLRAVHDGVMHLRHELVAHAGNSGHELALVQVVLRPPPQLPGVVGIGLPSMRLQRLPDNDIHSFIHLIKEVRTKTGELLGTAAQALQKEYANMPIEVVYEKAVYPSPGT